MIMASLINTIHWWNSRLSPPIGFLANFWFLWMILCRTPKEMQKHSRILLQTCALDIILLAISTIGVPLILESNGIWLCLTDGLLFDQFFALFGPLAGIVHSQFYYGFIMIEIMSVSLQFIYRYLLLNRNFHICFCRYLQLLLIPFTAIFCFYIYFFHVLFPHISVHSKYAQEVFNVINLNEWKFYYTMDSNESNPILIGCGLFFTIVAYAIITFCGVKMVKFMKAHTGFSENTRRLNKQLTKTLIILSLLPFIQSFCGLFTTINIAVTGNNAATTNNLIAQGIANQFLVLLLILNPLDSIATNSPYRNAAMFWRKRKIEAKPPMVVQNIK